MSLVEEEGVLQGRSDSSTGRRLTNLWTQQAKNVTCQLLSRLLVRAESSHLILDVWPGGSSPVEDASQVPVPPRPTSYKGALGLPA